MQLATLLFGGAALLCLGPRLTFDGHVTNIPLPFALVARLPFLDNILPIRISFAAGALAAAIVAFGLDDHHRRSLAPQVSRRSPRVGAHELCLIVLLLVVVFQWPAWPYRTSPAPKLPSQILKLLPAGNPDALTYPYDKLQVIPMMWQARAGFPFTLLNGYAYHPGPDGRRSHEPNRMVPGGLQQFLSAEQGMPLYGTPPPFNAALVRSTRTAVARYDIRLVIVSLATRGSPMVVQLLTLAFGRPTEIDSRFAMWKLS